jgi:hypothetical protein
MADYSYASEAFFSELLRISSTIVWKNSSIAKQKEDPTQSVYVDQFMLAHQGKLTFDLIFSFDINVLIASGLTEQQAADGSEVSTEIPLDKRDVCTKNQIEYILSSYDEPNDYYRMLSGLPDRDDVEFVYNTKYPQISDDVTPIHMLPSDVLYLLESVGYLDELIQEYPNKKYLNHLASKKIDPYTARNSADYAILWIDHSDFSSLVNDFKETYDSCRYMITSVFNSQNIKNNNNDYIGFIGMTILFATIIQMHKKFLDADVTREFYDLDSLRYVYDSYGVPFYSAIPMQYHKLIVKNINRLISYKGSTQVIYELFDIFGLPDMSIYEYYILKTHRFVNGKPVFSKNEDGSYNLKAMYDIKFAKVQLYNDPVSDISDPQNHVSYEDMVRNDPYWISDKELIDKIYQEEYNYLESKYLGIQTTFDMMKIMYESCYYLKMIIDNRKLLSATSVYNNNIKLYTNLFDLVVYICALMCKKYGYEGNIPTDPHEIGKVLGFNFNLDLETLKEYITQEDYLKHDTQLLEYLSTLKVYSLESVRNVYANLTELRKYLMKKMSETADPEEYWVYYELYNSIMYSEYVKDVFKKSDGETASSFADMLRNTNLTLYERLTNDDDYDIGEEISYSIYLLKSSCDELSHIEYMDSMNIDNVIEYLLKLVEFFKSAKADVTSYTVVYSLASALDNHIKIMNYIQVINESRSFVDYIDELDDMIHLCRDLTYFRDNLITLLDSSRLLFSRHFIDAKIDQLTDYIKTISHLIKDITVTTEFVDTISDINIHLLDDDEFVMHDMVSLLYDDVKEIIKYLVSDKFNLDTTIATITQTLKDSGELVSEETFTDYIVKGLTIQRLMTSYKKEDYITRINSTHHSESDIMFDDKFVSYVVKYILEFSDQNYDSLVESIKEIIGKNQLNSVYNQHDSSINTINHISVLSTDNYVEMVSKLVSEIYKHYMNSEHILDSELHGLDQSINVSEYSKTTGELVNSSNRIKRVSLNTINDQLVLLHESTIEE